MKTILAVDDEQDLLDLIDYNLKKAGFEVLLANDGQEALKKAQKHHPDLILLDIMMPKMNGLETVEALRTSKELNKIPVVFLTARSDEKTEVAGLDKGGDDYINKPISFSTLISHIKAVLRRYEETEGPDQINIHNLIIDRDRYTVTQDNKAIQLPRKEFELLYFLASKKGKVMNRQTLLDNVWGQDVFVVDRTIDVHIRKIRKKLGDRFIETVKGVGYRFKA